MTDIKKKKEKKESARVMVIYFDEEKTCSQRIEPRGDFNGDWKGLADAITDKKYHSYITL